MGKKYPVILKFWHACGIESVADRLDVGRRGPHAYIHHPDRRLLLS